MKIHFLKNGMPIVTAVLAIAGAFATTSMQSDSKGFASVVGYTLNAQGECNIAVACDDLGLSFCRLGTSGPIAYGKSPHGQCVEALYRQQP